MVIGGLTALIAFGIALIYRANRIVNFAQAELGTVASIVAIMLVIQHDLNFFVAIATGIVAGNGRVIRAKAILSNATIKNTIFRLAGEENFPADYIAAAKAVRRLLAGPNPPTAFTSTIPRARARSSSGSSLAPKSSAWKSMPATGSITP